MNIRISGLVALILAGPAVAQEWGRVLSSTPMLTQVAQPREVCEDVVQPGVSHGGGAGAVLGAIAGGAIGQAIGQGNGRAAATAIGIVGGAMVGDRIEGPPTRADRIQRQCHIVQSLEQRVTGYEVRYEYAGRQYVAQMPTDPGPWVRLQVTPVGAAQPPAAPPPKVGVYQTQPEPVTRTTIVESRTVFVPLAPIWVRPYPHHAHPPAAVLPWRGGPPLRRHHGQPWR